MKRPVIMGWSGALGVALIMAACGSATTGATSAATPADLAATQTSTAAQPTTAAPRTAAPQTTTAVASVAPGGGTACSLVTEQEASTVLGSDPGPGRAQAGAQATVCVYSLPDGHALSVALNPHFSRTEFDNAKAQVFAGAKVQPEKGTVVDMPGVGDIGFIVWTTNLGICIFMKGSSHVTISVNAPSGLASPVDTMTSLGKTAAGRV